MSAPTATTNPAEAAPTNITNNNKADEENALASSAGSTTMASQQTGIPVAVPVVVKTYHSSTLPSQSIMGPRAQYLTGADPVIEQQQRTHLSSSGLGFTFIRAGVVDVKGHVVVPRSISLFNLCHGSDLDFSQAIFVHPVTTVRVLTICGGIRITIPRGVRVEASGLAICGSMEGLDDYGRAANNAVLEAPLIRIVGISICGGAGADLNLAVEPLVIVKHHLQDQVTVV